MCHKRHHLSNRVTPEVVFATRQGRQQIRAPGQWEALNYSSGQVCEDSKRGLTALRVPTRLYICLNNPNGNNKNHSVETKKSCFSWSGGKKKEEEEKSKTVVSGADNND